MAKSKTIIFDFDGTIADTLEISARIFNRFAADFNCKPIDFEQKERFRSMKTHEFFHACGIPLIKVPAIALKLKKELRKEIQNIPLIDGIELALKEIKEAGYSLGVMSSNNKQNIKAFLNHHRLTHVFDFVHSGKNIFGKDKAVLRLLYKHRLKRNQAVYIGDETRDVDALKRIKVPIIAVSWGFNSKEVLKELNPDFLINKPEELLTTISLV